MYMKKVFIIVFLILQGLYASAQQKTFFGLTLGNNYTQEEVNKIIPETTGGLYSVTEWEDGSAEISEIKIALLKDIVPPIMATVTPRKISRKTPLYRLNFDTSGGLRGVSLIYDNSCGLPSIVYQQLADSLSKIYPMTPHENKEGLQCLDVDGMAVTLTKEEDSIILLYSDASYIEKIVSNIIPPIQDKFLGLKMGEKYSVEKVKTLVGMKGDFMESERTAVGTRLIFSKMAYAGKIWDYGEIILSLDGAFYKISIYDSVNDYYDDRTEAKSIYNNYKETLDKKYGGAVGPVVEEKGEDLSSTYLGSNGIWLELYTRRGKSSGGNYRRYVGMVYSHMGIISQFQEATENEL